MCVNVKCDYLVDQKQLSIYYVSNPMLRIWDTQKNTQEGAYDLANIWNN